MRQGLRATGGEGSHVMVDDAISAQDAKQIPAEDSAWALSSVAPAPSAVRRKCGSGPSQQRTPHRS